MAADASWWRKLLRRAAAPPGNPTPEIAAVGAAYPADNIDDPRDAISFGYRVIFLGRGLTALWAVFAPLDEGIPAPGVVVVESHRKAISHLTGGTVTTVKVRENQMVKEGDVLLELDSVRAESARYTVLQ